MKIEGLPPELDAAVERVNARMVASHGPDAEVGEAFVRSQGVNVDDVCRALMSGELEPPMIAAVLGLAEAGGVQVHEIGHRVSCGEHGALIQQALTSMFMTGWHLRGELGS